MYGIALLNVTTHLFTTISQRLLNVAWYVKPVDNLLTYITEYSSGSFPYACSRDTLDFVCGEFKATRDFWETWIAHLLLQVIKSFGWCLHGAAASPIYVVFFGEVSVAGACRAQSPER